MLDGKLLRGKLRLHEPPTRFAEAFGSNRVAQQRKDVSGKLPVVLVRKEQPRFAVLDHLGNSIDRSGHDWFSSRHRLEDRERQTLPMGAQDEHVDSPEKACHVLTLTGEHKRVADAAFVEGSAHSSIVFTVRLARVVSCHQKSSARLFGEHSRGRPRERWIVLLRCHARHHADERGGGGNAQLSSNVGRIIADGCDGQNVNAVIDNGSTRWCDAARKVSPRVSRHEDKAAAPARESCSRAGTSRRSDCECGKERELAPAILPDPHAEQQADRRSAPDRLAAAGSLWLWREKPAGNVPHVGSSVRPVRMACTARRRR